MLTLNEYLTKVPSGGFLGELNHILLYDSWVLMVDISNAEKQDGCQHFQDVFKTFMCLLGNYKVLITNSRLIQD